MSNETTWTLEQVRAALQNWGFTPPAVAQACEALTREAARRSQPAPEAVPVCPKCGTAFKQPVWPGASDVKCGECGTWFPPADRAKAKGGERTCCDTRDGESHNAQRCVYMVGNFAPEQPAAPPGFRVVGTSVGVDWRTVPGKTWVRLARPVDGGEPPKGPPRQMEDRHHPLVTDWNAGGYDILEPIVDPPAPVAHESDKIPREPGCQCHQEIGDSPCRVHGEEEESAAPAVPQPGVPAGFVLGEGWRVHDREWVCTEGPPDCCEPCVYDKGGGAGVCAAHAISAQAIVRAPVTPIHAGDQIGQLSAKNAPKGAKSHGTGGGDLIAPVTPSGVQSGKQDDATTMAILRELMPNASGAADEIATLRAANVDLRAQLAARDARIAGLEATGADLVRRAQEAEASRDEALRAVEALASTIAARDAEVAELRGKLAAASDEATARERERVNGWWAWWWTSAVGEGRDGALKEGIASGAPAPEVG